MTNRFIKGNTYQVVQDGAKISVRESTGPYSWTWTDVQLEVSDILVYLGKRPGVGHDNVKHDVFKRERDGVLGEFRPNFWGKADRNGEYLTEDNSEANN
jgi:hypothetical protein